MTDFSDIEDDFFTGKEHTPLRKMLFCFLLMKR